MVIHKISSLLNVNSGNTATATNYKIVRTSPTLNSNNKKITNKSLNLPTITNNNIKFYFLDTSPNTIALNQNIK